MTPKHSRWIAVLGASTASVVFVVLLVLLSVPIVQASSGYCLVGLRIYAFESESIFGPSWANVSFRGAEFSFHIWCGTPTPFPSQICGTVTEPGGSAEMFTFFEPEAPQLNPPWQTWTSPDGTVGAQYHPGGVVQLLVTI
ncbi:MAG: hypothetical protein L3J91_02430 [Thermoplasmata archaeon]|nr:hypothetical protein [Thermoplasmata archaeon]